MAISYFASKDFKIIKEVFNGIAVGDRKYEEILLRQVYKSVTTPEHKVYVLNSFMDSYKRLNFALEDVINGAPIYRLGKDLYNTIKNIKYCDTDIETLANKLPPMNILVELPYEDYLGRVKTKALCVNTKQYKNAEDSIILIGPLGLREYPFKQSFPIVSTRKEEFVEEILKVQKLILDIVLYIAFGSEDIVKQDNEYRISRERPAVPKHLKHKFEFNSIMVGFNYKKQFKFHVDGCTVSGHFRWQPHGPERSKLKLIYIHPFEKQFNKQGETHENN
jgi:hypothetical protein